MDGYGSYGGGGGGGMGDRRMEIVSGKGLGACHRAYSPNRHTTPPNRHTPPPPMPARDSWSGHGGGGGGAAGAAASSKPWGFTDPEMKRKKRIARYKAYTVEGRVKASLRRGFQWIKDRCSQIVHGY